MSSLNGTPACWKQFLYDVLAMVKQLGIPTYFLTLSSADLRWEELPFIINKLNNLGLSLEELKSLSYLNGCNLLNNNPVLVASHFQYKVEVLFKDIILVGRLGKTKHYAIRTEFHERGRPHIHSFIWILVFVYDNFVFTKGVVHISILLYGFSFSFMIISFSRKG